MIMFFVDVNRYYWGTYSVYFVICADGITLGCETWPTRSDKDVDGKTRCKCQPKNCKCSLVLSVYMYYNFLFAEGEQVGVLWTL